MPIYKLQIKLFAIRIIGIRFAYWHHIVPNDSEARNPSHCRNWVDASAGRPKRKNTVKGFRYVPARIFYKNSGREFFNIQSAGYTPPRNQKAAFTGGSVCQKNLAHQPLVRMLNFLLIISLSIVIPLL